eukprot:CAMPEP_0185696878 /NCGR_PEP_ID=MMETSP1164-20130828/5400_1 /TAXON_ID=1104430 /ORGANISM="Chrysoreinhardia sp, Strain CCMP2950" /LENGTH=316 /DNA_ID=CAMNT_0028363767 /DNA_START=155 /DNA_END=1105 /DNA_ORIENTATION=-
MIKCTSDVPALQYLSPRLRGVLAWVIASGFATSFYASVILIVIAVLNVSPSHTPAAIMIAIVALSVVPVSEWPRVRRLGQALYETFDAWHSPCDVMALRAAAGKNKLIFCLHPHGIVPLHTLMFCSLCDQLMHRTASFQIASASVLFYVPVLRAFVTWFGGVPADYNSLRDVLKRRHLLVTPGGLAEMMQGERGADIIVWNKRRGICRLALETGAHLVPVYVFNNDYFDHYPLTSLSRRIRISVLVFWGQLGLPIPYKPQGPLLTAIGSPIKSKRIDNPTIDDVDDLHTRYGAAMRALFDANKASAGKPNANLLIT